MRETGNRSVLQAGGHETHRSEPASLVGNDPGKVNRVVGLAGFPIIKNQSPAGQIGPGDTRDFYELVFVKPKIVVVEFIDPDAVPGIDDQGGTPAEHRGHPRALGIQEPVTGHDHALRDFQLQHGGWRGGWFGTAPLYGKRLAMQDRQQQGCDKME